MDASNDQIPISLHSRMHETSRLPLSAWLWTGEKIFAKYARVAWPNKCHEFKLPVEQALCPPDHPSVVYQPRLSVFNLDPTKIQNEWLPKVSLFLLAPESLTQSPTVKKTLSFYLRWGTSLPPLAWPWDLLPKSMSTFHRSVMPRIKLRGKNEGSVFFSGAPAAIEDMTSGKGRPSAKAVHNLGKLLLKILWVQYPPPSSRGLWQYAASPNPISYDSKRCDAKTLYLLFGGFNPPEKYYWSLSNKGEH